MGGRAFSALIFTLALGVAGVFLGSAFGLGDGLGVVLAISAASYFIVAAIDDHSQRG